jgi:phosphate transport system substrate-binding protein
MTTRPRSLRTLPWTLSLLAAFALTACGSGTSGGGSPTPEDVKIIAPDLEVVKTLKGAIIIDGSSTVYPISEAVCEEWNAFATDAKASAGASGTGGGFKKFAEGKLPVTGASRPIKDKEIDKLKEAGIAFIELPIAYDGVTVVIHPKNDWATTMTVADLKTLWSPEAQGTVMKWNQIRPEWPDKEIRLYGPGVDSGTYDYFTAAIVGTEHASRGDFTQSEDDNVLVQGVAGDQYALGFFGYAYYEENKSKLTAVKIDGGKGPVAPSVETVMDGSYSPLSRPIFIYLSKAGAAKPQVRAFVEFYLEIAPQIVSEVGYIPLPDAEYQAGVSALAGF